LNFRMLYRRLVFLLAVSLVVSSAVRALAAEAQKDKAPSPAVSAADMEQYRRALAEYQAARAAYTAAADAYWSSVVQQRRQRNAKRANHEALSIDDYVLTQPPVYAGPPKPRDPSKPTEPPPPYVPVVTDFLSSARQEFNFVPRTPQSESEFKRAYANVALAAGLNPEQIVRIYSFEAGGNGEYDVQAGREHEKQARAITTALGYNQLLATNSVEIIAESGNRIVKSLQARAASLPSAERKALESRLAIVRKMIDFAKSVPDDWNQHQVLANTPKGFGIHALNLDVDIGPYLQTQKLMDSVNFARRKGFSGALTAAELEMMNLTGDGNGFDMVTMPRDWRDRVPTSNFFQHGGYRDNPVAQRNNVVSKLIAATDAQMDRESRQPGARDLAAALR
jgi:hypothetical protein